MILIKNLIILLTLSGFSKKDHLVGCNFISSDRFWFLYTYSDGYVVLFLLNRLLPHQVGISNCQYQKKYKFLPFRFVFCLFLWTAFFGIWSLNACKLAILIDRNFIFVLFNSLYGPLCYDRVNSIQTKRTVYYAIPPL